MYGQKTKGLFLSGPLFSCEPPVLTNPRIPGKCGCAFGPPPLGRRTPAHCQSILPPATVCKALMAHLQLSRAERRRSRVLSYIGEKETYIRSDAQEVSLPQGTRGHSMRSTDSSGICSSDIYLTLCAWTVLDTDFVRLEQEQPIKGEKLKLQERVKEGRATVTSFSELKLGV